MTMFEEEQAQDADSLDARLAGNGAVLFQYHPGIGLEDDRLQAWQRLR